MDQQYTRSMIEGVEAEIAQNTSTELPVNTDQVQYSAEIRKIDAAESVCYETEEQDEPIDGDVCGPDALYTALGEGLILALEVDSRSTYFGRKRPSQERLQTEDLDNMYRLQIQENTDNVDAMAKMLAYTWMGGNGDKMSPLVRIEDARLLTLDRFSSQLGEVGDRIALVMYAPSVSSRGLISYACNENIQLTKDFSMRPRAYGQKLILDSAKTSVFSNALALDNAMRMVANGKLKPVPRFDPPPVLLGFPLNYKIEVEWNKDMCDEVMRVFRPDQPVLTCFKSPGGIVRCARDENGFRVYGLEQEGNLLYKYIPTWATKRYAINVGDVTAAGQVIGDIPRESFSTMREIRERYALKAIEWIEAAIVDEYTEHVTVNENHYTGTVERQWNVIPLRFVKKQFLKSTRCFLDMHKHLGRTYITDNGVETVKDVPRIDVCVFDRYPTASDFIIHNPGEWMADFSKLHIHYPDVAARFELRCPV